MCGSCIIDGIQREQGQAARFRLELGNHETLFSIIMNPRPKMLLPNTPNRDEHDACNPQIAERPTPMQTENPLQTPVGIPMVTTTSKRDITLLS
jgi:hypothetical protein